MGHKTLEHEVYAQICAAIMDHRLPAGTRLGEDSTGEIFGVNRTVVRRALSRLAHEKIVEFRPHRSAIVARPSIREARDVFRARVLIEREIVVLAARVATPEQIGRLRDIELGERKALEQGDRRAWIRLSGAFHLELAGIAGNDVLSGFLGELVSRTSLIIGLYAIEGQSACCRDDHGALSDAVARGEEAAAAELMTRHLQRCEQGLRLEARSPNVDPADVLGGRAAARIHARERPA